MEVTLVSSYHYHCHMFHWEEQCARHGGRQSHGQLALISPSPLHCLGQWVPAQLPHTLECQVPHSPFLALREPAVSYRETDVQVKLYGEAEREMTSEGGLEEFIRVYLVEKEWRDLSVKLPKTWRCGKLWAVMVVAMVGGQGVLVFLMFPCSHSCSWIHPCITTPASSSRFHPPAQISTDRGQLKFPFHQDFLFGDLCLSWLSVFPCPTGRSSSGRIVRVCLLPGNKRW